MADYLTLTFIITGLFFHALGALSLHRFKDAFTRLHGAALCTTLGTILIAIAVMLNATATGMPGLAIRAFFALIFLMTANAAGAHAIARAAYLHGIKADLPAGNELAGDN